MRRRLFIAIICLGALPGLSGCAGSAGEAGAGGSRMLGGWAEPASGTAGSAERAGRPAIVRGGGGTQGGAAFLQFGTPQAAASMAPAGPRPIELEPGGAAMTLQFVNADIQDFVAAVFDEILHEPVIIDPAVAGKVTVRTGGPVARTAAVEIVRQMLDLNGAELSHVGTVWRVAARPGGPARSAGPARIIRLEHVGAEEARAAIQGFAGETVQIAALPGAGALVLSGAAQDADPLAGLIASLDVDGMEGQSFGLLPLREAGAAAVARDLVQVFASAGPRFQAIPVARMNAVLVIAPGAELLRRAQRWVLRLDHESRDAGRIFVYPVQNRRASELAAVLRRMFSRGAPGGDAPDESEAGAPLSPGFAPRPSGGMPAIEPGTGTPDAPAGAQARLEAAFRSAGDAGSPEKTSIEADPATNSLVVTASPREWQAIKAAIARLDIQPSQVLIEATIAEVVLNDELRHGVRWYFEAGNHSLASSLGSEVVTAGLPGPNYTFSAGNSRLILSALEEVSKVEIVSSPALTVLDNQTATLKVGDQVPIATRSAQSLSDPAAPVVNDISLRDTGVILSVTPRVSASGLVQLDISQEVSDVVETTSSGINSPTIRQRKIESTVAVASGSEIVLGGLIGTQREKGNSGIPLLKDIPFIGNAFKTNAFDTKTRSELLIILRLTVMGSRSEVEAVTRAVRASMAGAAGAIRQ